MGSVPQDMRNIIAEHARGWRGDAWVGCSGNFTIERVLTTIGGLSLHSNDVTGYSSALGWFFSGQEVPFTLKPESEELLSWLKPYLETDIDRVATLMLGTRFLAHVEDPNRFYARVLAGTKSQFPRMHAKTVEKLKDSPLKLASYHPMDVREWVRDVVPPEDPVAMFPPFYGGMRSAAQQKVVGDYEKQFEGIDKHFDWPAPDYPELDEAGKDELLELVVDRPEWVLGLHVRRDELREYLRGMVQTANRGMTIYLYARTAHLRVVRPRQDVAPILMPKIGHDDELGDRMTLHVLSAAQFSMIRSQFMSKTIKPGSPALPVAVAVDGKIIGAFAFDDFDPNMGDSTTTAYLLSDFPVSWSQYRRLAKLVVIAALSDEARLLFQRDLARPITHLATTAFSDRPMSAKYGRGIPGMKLLNRGKGKDGIHAFTLNYGAPMGQWTLQEGLDLWKKKHGSDVRKKEEIPV